MVCSCFPAKLSNLEHTVSENLMPDETLLWLCKEHYRLGLFVELCTLGSVSTALVVTRKISDSNTFTPATWRSVLLLLVQIVIIALVIAGLIATSYPHPNSWVMVPALLVILLLRLFSQQAFAITNKRLICIAVPKGRILWWLNLDKLNDVDIRNRKNGAKDLVLNFSSAPTGVDGRQTSISKYALFGVDEPEQLKNVLLNNRIAI